VASDSRSGRSAQQNEVLINAASGETRVAILEQGLFTELYIEREQEQSVAGMVALGKVTRVLPGMQAAFVDIGLEKAAFLYVGDYMDERSALAGEEGEQDGRGRRRGRNGNGRQPPRIEGLLREGQEIVVQVAKDPIGTKGARITSHVSIAGRHLVLTPWSKRVGVSRRIDSDRERRRLRGVVSRIRPKDLGFIIRTAGKGTTEPDLEADVRYLTSAWDEVQVRKEELRAPAELHRELSLPLRVLRDFANSRTRRIVVDDDETFSQMQSFLERFVADPKPQLEHYQGPMPIFDHFGIESNIDTNLGKKVWLKSGGYLIVDQSEALTAIDVNTGRYVGKQNLEETVLKTNLEAVKEVVNQLRFRNIGGLIIIDLIDMESAENRDKVYRALQEALRADKSKTNIFKISELGLVEMTRKRTRENLVQQLCEPCSYCEGRGYVLSPESVAYKLLREIRKDLPRFCGRHIAVTVASPVAEILLGRARKSVASLGQELGREIEIRARPGQHQEQFEVTALDEGPPVSLELSWLAGKPAKAAPAEEAAESDGQTESEEQVASEEPALDDEQTASEEPALDDEQTAAGRGAAEQESAQQAVRLETVESPADSPASSEPRVDDPDTPEGTESPLATPAAAEDEPEPAIEPAPKPPLARSVGARAAAEILDAEEENPIIRRSERLEET
jgi:ribonuclease G